MDKISKEDIISDEAIKNIQKLTYKIDKLDKKLGILCEKHNIPKNDILNILSEKYYKDLLIKYMKHIYGMEDMTYVSEANTSKNKYLSKTDIEILQIISKDICGW